MRKSLSPFFFILFLLLFACAGAKPDRYQAVCWQASMAAAIIMQSYGYPTEITIQETGIEGVAHAQVRAYDRYSGQWRWVVIDGPWPTVTWGERESGEVTKVIDEEELVDKARDLVQYRTSTLRNRP